MKKLLVTSVLLLGVVSLLGYGLWTNFQFKKTQTVNWEIYNNSNGLSFEYPLNLEKLVLNNQFDLSIQSKQDIVNRFEKFKDEGCPSTCGRFVADPSLLQKQFDILEKINLLSDCVLSTIDKKDINDNFILFSGGISNKFQIEGIRLNSGQCGLKIVASDGFDVSLDNIYYKVSLIGNNKIINISFPMYPHNVFQGVDSLWTDIGFDSVKSVCDLSCIEKESNYFKNINVNNNVEKQTIETYDQIVASLKYIGQ